MTEPRYGLLRSRDLRAALAAVGDLAEASGQADGARGFALAGVQVLSRLVASELTTLSRCDLRSGRRQVYGVPPGAIDEQARAAFDRHFDSHPLVRYHASLGGAYAHRISDSVTSAQFRQTPLFCDYYRRVGLSHALALPVRMDGQELVSFVLNRQGRDFSDRELALLDALRRPLALLFGRVCAAERAPHALDWVRVAQHRLTPREAEVLQWVAGGKTDRDVADLLGCSPRTVHKHLQRCYAKLGVETRTAAVMRVLARN